MFQITVWAVLKCLGKVSGILSSLEQHRLQFVSFSGKFGGRGPSAQSRNTAVFTAFNNKCKKIRVLVTSEQSNCSVFSKILQQKAPAL